MVPYGAYQYSAHLPTQQFSHYSIILPPGELLVKIYKEVPYSYLEWNCHNIVPCGAYQYCTHLPSQKFLQLLCQTVFQVAASFFFFFFVFLSAVFVAKYYTHLLNNGLQTFHFMNRE